MGRRIAVTLVAAGIVAAIGWPTAAFAATADYAPGLALTGAGLAFTGTGTSAVVPCGSTTITGAGFQPTGSITFSLGRVHLGTTTTGKDGSFSASFTIPPGLHPGTYKLISTGTGGKTTTTELLIGKGGCSGVPLLTRSTVVPGESTVVKGMGCFPGSQVVLTIAGQEVGQATANSQGRFSVPITPPNSGPGQVMVTASCGSRTFGLLLSVVATSAIATPEATTAVFGVFVLLGLVLLWGQFGSSASRRRRKQRRA
jgi:hypothetical protein